MRIYTKILLITLPLVLLALLAGTGITYSLSRNALTDLAKKWLETKLSEAMHTAVENDEILRRFGLENVAANVKNAQGDAGEAMLSIEVGELGYVYVVDSQGIIAVHPDGRRVGSDVSGETWFREMRSGQRGRLAYSWQGVRHLAMYEYFQPWGWYVVATDPQSEVYGTVNRTGTYVLILGTVGSVVMAMALMLLTRRLTAPLRLLEAGAEQIGHGNLEARIPIHARDEFGDLAAVFNQMTAQLQETLVELEQRANQLTTLHETALDITTRRDMTELLEAIVARAANLLGVTGGGVYIVDPGGETLTLAALHGPGQEFLGTQLHGGEGMAGKVLESGQPLIVEDYERWAGQAAAYSNVQWGSVIEVPLLLAGRGIGVLSCHTASGPTRAFAQDAVRLLEGLARQAAIAIENARLLEAERAARERAETLQAATRALSATLDLPQVFELILSELQRVVPHDSASVQQLKGDQLEIIGGHGFPNLEKLLGVSFDLRSGDNPNREVVRTRAPVILDDAPTLYREFHAEPHAQAGIRSWLGAPLLFGDRLIGMIALDKQEAGFYTEEHGRLASAFAAQAAIAIENARLFEGEQRRARDMALLNDITRAAVEKLDLHEMLQTLADRLGELIGADGCYITLWDEARQMTIPVAAYGELRETYPSPRSEPGELTMTESVLRAGHALVAEDVFNSPYLSPHIAAKYPAYSLLGLPLIAGGQKLGAALIAFNQPHRFTPDEVARGEQAAGQIALAVAKARLFEDVQRHSAELEQRVAERTAELKERVTEVETLNRAMTNLLEDLQAAHRRTEEMAQQVLETNEELEAFAYTVSHDLRAPLRAMQGFAEALLEDYEHALDATGQEYGQRIVGAAQRMDTLIQDLLAYSRLTRAEIRLKPASLERVVEEVLRQLGAEIREKEAQVRVEKPLPDVVGHHATLVQVVGNLVSNAVTFVAPEVQPRVRVWAEMGMGAGVQGSPSATLRTGGGAGEHMPQDVVRLWVEDSGIGISPEHQERIFLVFERLHGIEVYPGTGIGLAIVRKAMERMGGRVGVESEAGKGSRFWVELPRACSVERGAWSVERGAWSDHASER